MVGKLSFSFAFSVTDLLNENFVKTAGQTNSISSGPWYASTDGVLFV